MPTGNRREGGAPTNERPTARHVAGPWRRLPPRSGGYPLEPARTASRMSSTYPNIAP